ncbi:hypothetical protein LshimejAT787_0802560 [Lyophyllum shimeji]|uniref:Amino acid transporter n=1 Tax=Lyophyllum shimeji TaxID=47721 RepID=A0A9P3PQY1_LYOSH|nr:hypothetical protein LshimejAT787_0802560 [Lyophyllum shimeji]
MLNIGQITGSGIYAVPGVTLRSVGSIGLLFIYWIIGALFALAGRALYSQYASIFPREGLGRSGLPAASVPAPAISHLHLVCCDHNIDVVQRSECNYIGSSRCGLCYRWSKCGSLQSGRFASSTLSLFLAFMVVTGAAVLLGFTRIEDPYANFHNLFEGSSRNPNALATALVKVNHAFVGWHGASNVLGDIREMRANLLPRSSSAAFLVPLLECRRIAELSLSDRRDLLPNNTGHCKTRTPSIPGFLFLDTALRDASWPRVTKGFLTYLVVLAMPAKDAFNFVLDLASYPNLVFQCAMAAGVGKSEPSLVYLAPYSKRAIASSLHTSRLACSFFRCPGSRLNQDTQM